MSGTVVVTGAARGIGRAIGERLQAEGYTVVGVDIGDGLADTSFEPVQVDLTSPDGPEVVDRAVERLGQPLVAVVNNAGITRDARLVNLKEDDVAAVLDVNLGAAYRLTRALIPRLEAGSSIVNLASRAYLGNFGQFNYSMSKGGVAGMTRALALELAPDVRVNAIAPGLIATEMSMAIPEDIRTKMVDNIPLGRMGEPSEVADLVAWLIRPGYITGEVIVIGGGRSLA
ncbi:MAG: SDR family oxidoreductase [Actinomycetes bacterium]|jgi:NAD(P)-dependent dehydrogenase (short-subunit alcohol dehydrogenase family)|nr:SDR family oxidoreductase [Acidimicrobiia bacterium]